MAEIDVTRTGRRQFQVTVDSHSYDVTVPPSMSDDEAVVRESFVFLLEREPPESILPSFSLDIIRRYFPEYDDEMRRRLGDQPG